MAVKRRKSEKSIGRKKAPASSSKKKTAGRTFATHHPYEAKIKKSVKSLLTDAKAIFAKLNHYDKNRSPTAGIIGMIEELVEELTNGQSDQTKHEDAIEQALYAIAGIDDQYIINGDSPDTNADKPTADTHEGRVAELLTTINSICREVLELLDPGIDAGQQPDPNDYADAQDFIVAIASDTQGVVALIGSDIRAVHTRGRYSTFSK